MKTLGYSLLGIGSTGLLALAGALVHAHSYKLRRRSVVLPHPDRAEASGLRILHISDMHLLVSNKKRRTFLRGLADTCPDFVVCTGDLIAEDVGIDAVLADLDELLQVPGAFVFGSNDYHAPAPRNPVRYLFGSTAKTAEESSNTATTSSLDTEKLRAGLTAGGWIDLNNRRETVSVGPWTLDLVGVDDPHIGRDEMPPATDFTADDEASPYRIRIGVAHAPYIRVLDAFVDEGAQLIFAGHTHGGQVALPVVGALVTNCDLPTRYAHGMFEWPPEEVITGDGAILGWDTNTPDGAGRAIVNVSAGIGTSPFTPFRTFCAPEAIQIDIIPL